MADDGGKKADREFQVITSALDDYRRLIAAGKVQRWEVVKWGVTVNLALATAAAAVQWEHNVVSVLFWLAFAVSIGSQLLVLHYNKRMTGARETASTLVNRLKSFHIDYDAILKTNVETAYSVLYYDCPELLIFSAILVVSPFLVLLKDIVSPGAIITDSEAYAARVFLAALVATLLSAMLGCLSSRTQVDRAKEANTRWCKYATAIRWAALISAIISFALFVYSAIVAAAPSLICNTLSILVLCWPRILF